MSLKHRHFDPITVPAEAGRRRVHRIECSQCPAHADVSANTYGGSRSHDDLLKIWRRAGWTVGSNANRDLCPACSMAKRASGRSKEEPVSDPMNAKVIPMPISAVQPEPPRKPTFDEKRLINGKIEEHYIDERTGYEPGWSDKRVAEDLGVPRAWVAELRENNFGPAHENEELRALIEEARGLRDEAQKIVTEARSIAGTMASRAEALSKAVAPLSDRLADVDKRLGLIEKVLR